jgi:predicted secreted protein
LPDAISFYPDGTADAAEIQLRDRDGFQLLLQLNPVTGRVHITEPTHE